jgi:hypothetical protein
VAIILENDNKYFVCGGPQIDPSTYRVILCEEEISLEEEEEKDGI